MKEYMARYCGPRDELRAKTALIHMERMNSEVIKAQFDDMSLMLDNQRIGFGWHAFPRCQFKIRRRVGG